MITNKVFFILGTASPHGKKPGLWLYITLCLETPGGMSGGVSMSVRAICRQFGIFNTIFHTRIDAVNLSSTLSQERLTLKGKMCCSVLGQL
jgi:hypothetical protein